MFGKLMKYELRYLIRIFAPMWAAVIALCVTFRLTIGPQMKGENLYIEGNEAIIPAVIGVVTVFAIMTMMIVATVVLIQRFYKGMYGDEGYLMFTLPVTTGSLIHSKALSAMLMLLGTEAVTLLGILVMVSFPQIWNELNMNLPEMFQMLLDMNGLTAGEAALLMFWLAVAGLLTAAQEIYMIGLAISVGQLWKKHPVAGAIIAFYVISIVIGGIEAVFGFNGSYMLMENLMYSDVAFGMLLYMTVRAVILLLVSFFGTKMIMEKKLNIA